MVGASCGPGNAENKCQIELSSNIPVNIMPRYVLRFDQHPPSVNGGGQVMYIVLPGWIWLLGGLVVGICSDTVTHPDVSRVADGQLQGLLSNVGGHTDWNF
jgi:hypothetical protein